MIEDAKYTNFEDFKDVYIKKLKLPDFQRDYEWTKKLFTQFLENLEKREDGEDRIVFIGNFIFYSGNDFKEKNEKENYLKKLLDNNNNSNDNKNNYWIIDGQQRLITLVSIYLYQNNSKKISQVEEVLNKLLKNEKSHEKEELNKFLKNLKKINFENIHFTYITTDNLDQAFMMFDSQNTRGEILTDFDLIKTYHISKIEDSSDRKNFARLWEQAYREELPNILFPSNLLHSFLSVLYLSRKIILSEEIDNIDIENRFFTTEEHRFFEKFKDNKTEDESLKVLGYVGAGKSFYEFVKYELLLFKYFIEKVNFFSVLFHNMEGTGNIYLTRAIVALAYIKVKLTKNFNFKDDRLFVFILDKFFNNRRKNNRVFSSTVKNLLKENIEFKFQNIFLLDYEELVNRYKDNDKNHQFNIFKKVIFEALKMY